MKNIRKYPQFSEDQAIEILKLANEKLGELFDEEYKINKRMKEIKVEMSAIDSLIGKLEDEYGLNIDEFVE